MARTKDQVDLVAPRPEVTRLFVFDRHLYRTSREKFDSCHVGKIVHIACLSI